MLKLSSWTRLRKMGSYWTLFRMLCRFHMQFGLSYSSTVCCYLYYLFWDEWKMSSRLLLPPRSNYTNTLPSRKLQPKSRAILMHNMSERVILLNDCIDITYW